MIVAFDRNISSTQDVPKADMAPVSLSYCKDGTAILTSYINDGIRHCPDSSDEEHPLGVLRPGANVVDQIQSQHEDLLARMRKVEEESADDDGSNFGGNFWKWFLSIIDQGLPILNTLVLSIVGGRRAHARIRRRRNLQRPPAVPAPAPASPPVPVVANLMTWISHNLFWHFKCHLISLGSFLRPLSIDPKIIFLKIIWFLINTLFHLWLDHNGPQCC